MEQQHHPASDPADHRDRQPATSTSDLGPDPDTSLRQLRALVARLLDDADHHIDSQVDSQVDSQADSRVGDEVERTGPDAKGPASSPSPAASRSAGARGPGSWGPGSWSAGSWAGEVREALERFQTLDEQLCGGAPLPKDWSWRAGPEAAIGVAPVGQARRQTSESDATAAAETCAEPS